MIWLSSDIARLSPRVTVSTSGSNRLASKATHYQHRWLRKALRNLDDEATYTATDDAATARLVAKRVLGAVIGECAGGWFTRLRRRNAEAA